MPAGVPEASCTAGRLPTCLFGVLALFTLGVPLMPTFHGPFCVAPTVHCTGTAALATLTLGVFPTLTVPCTGNGVFVTITGAEPAAPTGLLGTSDSASVKIPKPKAINISLLNYFTLVLL